MPLSLIIRYAKVTNMVKRLLALLLLAATLSQTTANRHNPILVDLAADSEIWSADLSDRIRTAPVLPVALSSVDFLPVPHRGHGTVVILIEAEGPSFIVTCSSPRSPPLSPAV